MLNIIGAIKQKENGEFFFQPLPQIDPLPEQHVKEEQREDAVSKQREAPKPQQDEDEKNLKAQNTVPVTEQDFSIDIPKKTPATPTPKSKSKKKKKTRLRIGEIIKNSKGSHKDIQRTRFLEDEVPRTREQYKRYQKIYKYKATRAKHLKKQRRF
jgi:hypothetical protein